MKFVANLILSLIEINFAVWTIICFMAFNLLGGAIFLLLSIGIGYALKEIND